MNETAGLQVCTMQSIFSSMEHISQAHVERHAWPPTVNLYCEFYASQALPANITLLCPFWAGGKHDEHQLHQLILSKLAA